MPIKAGVLISQIKSAIWPSGLAENLDAPVLAGQKSPIAMIFDEAMADICRWVPEEQENNIDTYDFCKTNFNCAVTVFAKPEGSVITRVSTIADGAYCDRVDYRMVDWPEPQVHARVFSRGITSDGMPKLPLGFVPADASTDWPFGRAFVGIWAIHRNNVYMFPWIQSNETVIVVWDGIKRYWNDDDLVTDTQAYRKAVKLYAQYAKCRDYGPKNEAPTFKAEYDTALAEYAWERREETRTRPSKIIDPFGVPPFLGGTMSLTCKSFIGTVELSIGAEGGTVTGLGLQFTPRIVKFTFAAPVNGLQMTVNEVAGTLTKDGFTFTLGGIIDTDGYIVTYEIS